MDCKTCESAPATDGERCATCAENRRFIDEHGARKPTSRNLDFTDAAEALRLLGEAADELSFPRAAEQRVTRDRVRAFLARIAKANDPGAAKEAAALAVGLSQADARDMGGAERERVCVADGCGQTAAHFDVVNVQRWPCCGKAEHCFATSGRTSRSGVPWRTEPLVAPAADRVSTSDRVTRHPVRYTLECDGDESEHQSAEAAVNNALMLDERSRVVVVLATIAAKGGGR